MTMGHARLVWSMIAEIVETTHQLAWNAGMVLVFINYLCAYHAILLIFA